MQRAWLSGWIGLALSAITACGAAPGVVADQPATGSGPATVLIRNGSNESIYYIQMSPVSQSTWGEDLLGDNVLARGQTFQLTNVTPGAWDLRVTDASGNYKEWRDQRLDAGGTYTLDVGSGDWHHD